MGVLLYHFDRSTVLNNLIEYTCHIPCTIDFVPRAEFGPVVFELDNLERNAAIGKSGSP
jgi:hypothetical protein